MEQKRGEEKNRHANDYFAIHSHFPPLLVRGQLSFLLIGSMQTLVHFSFCTRHQPWSLRVFFVCFLLPTWLFPFSQKTVTWMSQCSRWIWSSSLISAASCQWKTAADAEGGGGFNPLQTEFISSCILGVEDPDSLPCCHACSHGSM